MSCRAALDVGIMRIMRIMRLCDWCADCNNHPCCKSAPSPTTQRQANPRGIPRRPHTPLINLIVPTDLMQAPRPRRRHTAVAIKQALHTPTVNLPRAKPICAPRKSSGYHMACHGAARQGEDGRALLSDASAAPSHHAHRRCHHVAPTAYFPA